MQHGCKLRWRSPATMMALATGIIVALLWQPAIADELVAPRWSGQLLDPHRYELRFGGFAHGVGSIESGQIDINGEFVLPRLPFGRGEWWDFLVPRPHLGVMANLSGGTSYAYAGGLWTIPLPSRFFAEFFFGGACQRDDGRRRDARGFGLQSTVSCRRFARLQPHPELARHRYLRSHIQRKRCFRDELRSQPRPQ